MGKKQILPAAMVCMVLFFSAGCAVDSICMHETDCRDGETCVGGACKHTCTTDTQCDGGDICLAEGYCGDPECDRDADCVIDAVCLEHHCVPAQGCLGCPYPDAPHGTAQCLHGDCRLLSCENGWEDADGNPRNGCECDASAGPCTPDGDADEGEEQEIIPLECPADMVNIENMFCIDIWEASRPDATETDPGMDSGYATSRKNVRPWTITMLSVAKDACAAAGKRLCNPAEWQKACQGPSMTVYAYGDVYDPLMCNGIDTYCNCEPYPGCYNDCGAGLHMNPTNFFDTCTNGYGVFDMNGNVWEAVSSSDGAEHFRGGAYNCRDSATLHKCDYDATWGPAAKGFRCCK